MSKTVTIEFEKDGEIYEKTETELSVNKTSRGFSYVEFCDRSHQQCSLQDSSLATEPAIWLGIDKVEPKLFIPNQGWQDIPMPEGAHINGRMQLTQAMVKQLLPILTEFAKTGDYLANMKSYKDLSKPKKATKKKKKTS